MHVFCFILFVYLLLLFVFFVFADRICILILILRRRINIVLSCLVLSFIQILGQTVGVGVFTRGVVVAWVIWKF